MWHDCDGTDVGQEDVIITLYSYFLLVVFGMCQLGDVRLADGNNNNGTDGRVEVCIDREYGTICADQLWNSVDASVVCRQLGFSATGQLMHCMSQNEVVILLLLLQEP